MIDTGIKGFTLCYLLGHSVRSFEIVKEKKSIKGNLDFTPSVDNDKGVRGASS